MEAARKGDTTAVRAGLEKFTPDIDSKTVAFNAVHEACKGNHDECLAWIVRYIETTQMGFGILLSECVHADHTACTEVLLQHWKSVCSIQAHVPLVLGDSKGQTSGLCPAMWSDPAVCQVLIDAGADIETKDVEGHSPLHFACRSGSLDIVKLLVRAGAGVRVMDYEGHTCLTIAASCGHTETVRYLVGLKEVEVDYADDEDGTALHLAADNNHADVVQVLIDAGADIEVKDDRGRSPLLWSCSSGSLAVAKLLVRAGAGFGVTDNYGDTCLTIAAYRGHTETVRYLVGLKEVEVDHTDDDRCTALHLAADKNHADVVQVLIDAGADIEARDNTGYSPLHFACRSGSLDTVKLLVRAGAGVCVTGNDGHTCLTIAAWNGHTETVRYVLFLPEVEVDHANHKGCTALHWAADNNHTDVLQVLIDAGADIEARDNTGYSPLLIACRSGSLDTVKLLVRAGAGVRVTNNDGHTCLTIAASRGHTETVRYLLFLPEVEVDHANNVGSSALCAAAQGKYPDVVQVLIDAGADTEARGIGYSPLSAASHIGAFVIVKKLIEAGATARTPADDGCTCLHLAVFSGHTETVRYLLGFTDVDVDHADNKGYTALHEAAEKGNADMVQVLVDCGANTSLRTGRTALQLTQCRDCCRHLS